MAFVRGQFEQAEALFLQTRSLFEQASNEYDGALVGLDLVRLYLVQRRFDKIEASAAAVLRGLARYRLTPEVRELVEAFEIASRQQRVGVQLLQRLASHLEQGRRFESKD